ISDQTAALSLAHVVHKLSLGAKLSSARLEGDVFGRHRSAVEMLMVPLLGRSEEAPLTPIDSDGFTALQPMQRVAGAAENQNMGPGLVTMGRRVGADGKLHQMGGHSVAAHFDVKDRGFPLASRASIGFVGDR